MTTMTATMTPICSSDKRYRLPSSNITSQPLSMHIVRTTQINPQKYDYFTLTTL